MKNETYTLFREKDIDTIVNVISTELESRNESPFWTQKVIPFSRAILSILIPLRDNDLLFTPEGLKVDSLTPELFLDWSDFVSLKSLAFTIQQSNKSLKLERTKLSDEDILRYKNIDLYILGEYLSKYNVNLEYEYLDFPIANYNLHQGVSNVIKSLL